MQDFHALPKSDLGDFYLWAGELAPYKRPDLAVAAFKALDKPLVVIGGPETRIQALKLGAGRQTTFLGNVSFDVLKDHMARCKALIFPGEEDFGIVPVEVMASGRPVIAYGSGGILDSVEDGKTGLLFKDQTVDGLVKAVTAFEASDLANAGPKACVTRAQDFSEAAFIHGIQTALAKIGA